MIPVQEKFLYKKHLDYVAKTGFLQAVVFFSPSSPYFPLLDSISGKFHREKKNISDHIFYKNCVWVAFACTHTSIITFLGIRDHIEGKEDWPIHRKGKERDLSKLFVLHCKRLTVSFHTSKTDFFNVLIVFQAKCATLAQAKYSFRIV